MFSGDIRNNINNLFFFYGGIEVKPINKLYSRIIQSL